MVDVVCNSALVEVEGLAGGSSGVLRPVTDGHGVVPDSPELALKLQGLAVHALVVLKQTNTLSQNVLVKNTFI